MKTEEYQPFLAHVLSVVSGPAGMLHVDFEPSNTFTKATISAPVTEVATFYFDPSSSATTPEANVLKFRDIVNAAGKEIDGFWGAAAGVSHETDVKSLSTEGVSGTAVVLVLGWESVEKHMAFRYVFLFFSFPFFFLSPNSPDTDESLRLGKRASSKTTYICSQRASRNWRCTMFRFWSLCSKVR